MTYPSYFLRGCMVTSTNFKRACFSVQPKKTSSLPRLFEASGFYFCPFYTLTLPQYIVIID